MVMTTMLTQSARAPPTSSSLKKSGSPSPHPITTVAPVPPLFSSSAARRRFPLSSLTRAKTDDSASAAPKYPSTAPPSDEDDDGPVFVGQQDVPLEGVIQFERPGQTSRLRKRVALLAGGDVLALLIFSAIGRFSHGFAVLDLDTLRTADPFVAGWFLGAYFLGGYGDEGCGEKGFSSAVISAMKSWALGVPLGLSIRALLTGHIPQYNFIVVTMGSTAILLIGWRTLLSSILPYDKSKTNDDYRRGSPFELFECGCDSLLNFPSTGMSSDSFPDRVSGMAPSDLIFGSGQDSPIPSSLMEGLGRSSMVSISQFGSHQQHLLMENYGICPGSMYGLAQDPLFSRESSHYFGKWSVYSVCDKSRIFGAIRITGLENPRGGNVN